MIRLRKIRIEQTEEGAIEVLLFDDKLFCVTLEPDNADPKRFQIPPGVYPLNHFDGNRWKNTLEITVPGHSDLLFYAGDVEDPSLGSTILGSEAGKLKNKKKRAVLNSGNTFKRFQKEIAPNINADDEIEIIDFFKLYKKGEGIMLIKLLKSKTLDFNLFAGAVVTILTAFGVVVPVEVVTAVLCIGNFILRLVTKGAISEK